jgi:hypothetical protein
MFVVQRRIEKRKSFTPFVNCRSLRMPVTNQHLMKSEPGTYLLVGVTMTFTVLGWPPVITG